MCVDEQWSLGIILYELFVGKPPFFTNSIYSLVNLIVKVMKCMRVSARIRSVWCVLMSLPDRSVDGLTLHCVLGW